jgi:hypothetical protein
MKYSVNNQGCTLLQIKCKNNSYYRIFIMTELQRPYNLTLYSKLQKSLAPG